LRLGTWPARVGLGLWFPGLFQAVAALEYAQVNWLIKPFTIAALGVAPCTAMVFVWRQLVEGDANYTLVRVPVMLSLVALVNAWKPKSQE
jgi:arsenite transporter